jgi:hypothetical protein
LFFPEIFNLVNLFPLKVAFAPHAGRISNVSITAFSNSTFFKFVQLVTLIELQLMLFKFKVVIFDLSITAEIFDLDKSNDERL